MDIKEAVEKILTEWPEETKKGFKANELADFIRKDLKAIVEDLLTKNGLQNGLNRKVTASPGAGNWANVPWLAILDPRITETAQEGVYPVYLFKADSTGVYLSLMHGTTKLRDEFGNREAKNRTHRLTEIMRSKIPSLTEWDDSVLDLQTNSSLGKSYETANIGSKYYSFDSLPDNETFENDFVSIMQIYSKIAENWDEFSAAGQNSKNLDRVETRSEVDFTIFHKDINKAGIYLDETLVNRFIASLLSKPFTILTGLSGSGKTKLAEAFSSWITVSEEQICFLPVGADWTNREPLLGFPNALETGKYVKPDSGVLDIIIKAMNDKENPYFLILDEMNLSHVERYFADFLSAMEAKDSSIFLHPESEEWQRCDIPAKIKLPQNLFIIGTVNIDETTYMFSPKVLDRAHVIEFRVSEQEMEAFFRQASEMNMHFLTGEGASMGKSFVQKANEYASDDGDVISAFMPFFGELKEAGAEFGYRTASEIRTFIKKCIDITHGSMTREQVVDAAVMQKLLPKIHGSRNKIEKILVKLGNLCIYSGATEEFPNSSVEDIRYPISYEKLQRMHKRVISDGFTSYAEA
ncbi:MAG: DUF3578 domain-containing protein [Spirochaetales bacterium]|nr:DUF3578 domain-containing protein [Spirochaetales bacterium]